jgi:hypothetical protein
VQLRGFIILIAFILSGIECKGQDEKQSFLMLRAGILAADDWDCARVTVPQLTITKRSYQPVSIRPAFSLAHILYEGCGGLEKNAWGMEPGIILNAQFLDYAHIRGQVYAGLQTPSNPEQHMWYDVWIGETTLGIGITLWRIEGSLDFGIVRYEREFYPIAIKLGIAYVFNPAGSINPKGKQDGWNNGLKNPKNSSPL